MTVLFLQKTIDEKEETWYYKNDQWSIIGRRIKI